MKKQMKSNLFAAVVGCSLLGTFLMSSTDNTSTSAAAVQSPVLQEQSISTPAPEPIAAEPARLPFAFYLTLVTTFTNGGTINFDLVGEEGQSVLWSEMSKRGREE